MKEIKKNRRLLFQVHIATVFCFILAIIIIGVAVYKQNTEVFIQEKNRFMETDMETLKEYIPIAHDVPECLWDTIEKYPKEVEEAMTDEDFKYIADLLSYDDGQDIEVVYKKFCEKIVNESDENKIKAAKLVYYSMKSVDMYREFMLEYSRICYIDVRPEKMWEFFCDNIKKSKQIEIPKKTINFDIRNITNQLIYGGKDIVYEYIGIEDDVQNNEYYAAYSIMYDGDKPICLVCMMYDLTKDIRTLNSRLKSLIAFGAVFLLLIGFTLMIFLYITTLNPLLKIKESVAGYINDKDTSLVTRSMSKIKSRNEIGVLADDIARLAVEMDNYTRENIMLAAEKQRVSTELELATKIQYSMLSRDFPKRDEFEIYASMTPAKEVGGDFYDFFFIDENHLALTIADVSGKGIPAALFMMMSKILLEEFAMNDISPKKALERLNNKISENNKNDMFVTVWFGVMDIQTGHVIAANAGHEYPIVKKSEGGFELFKDKHGLVVGAMEGIKYREYEFDIEKNGVLFVYTDGAAEATNAQNELFRTDRMVDVLNENPSDSPEKLIHNMKEKIDEFVGDAPQFDDLTMLCIKYKGK